MKQTLLTILLTLLPLLASADDSGICGDGLTYVYIEATHTLTISKTSDGTGVMEVPFVKMNWIDRNPLFDDDGNPLFDDDGNQLFDDDGNKLFDNDTTCWATYRTEILAVIIEDGVTSISSWAFSGCSGLISITIPNSVTTIDNYAFYKCTSLTSLPIPNSVISIGDYAFAGCTGLISLLIPNSVMSIGDYVFHGCTGLTSLTIPNSVQTMGEWSFEGYNNLTSVTLPDCISAIGPRSFKNCSSLYSIEIPNGVTSIGIYAFAGCTGLISLLIPNSVMSIGDDAFMGCTGLTSLTIPNSVKHMGTWSFQNCDNLISVTLPDCISAIRPRSFEGCSCLCSIEIPNGVTSIGDYAFYGCSSLVSLSIPEGVTSIGEFAIFGCNGLTSLSIPDGVTSIKNSVFAGCSSLSSIIIPNNVTSIGDYAFSGCRGLNSITIPNSVTTIGESAFKNCSGLTSVTLPDNLKGIKKQSFYRCSRLTSITIPATVEVIYQEAFAGCSSLQQINALPTTPPFIYDKTFSNYSVPLIVPGGCVEAYKNAEHWKNFTNISGGTKIHKLTYIIDGEVLKTIDVLYGSDITPEPNPTKEGYAFSGWSVIPETMPDHDVIVNGTFTINKYKLIYMVDGEEYKTYEIEYNSAITPEAAPTKDSYTFSGWSEIPGTMPAHDVTVIGSFEKKNIVEYPNGAVEIDGICYNLIPKANAAEVTFKEYPYSGDVVIPSSFIYDGIEYTVSAIGRAAFCDDGSITSVSIPSSVKSIGEIAFGNSKTLSTIYISDISSWCKVDFKSYPLSGRHLFLNGKELENLVIPDEITYISQYAFSGCESFKSVVIGNGITKVQGFENCKNLTSITIGKNVESISAFTGCDNLESIYINDLKKWCSISFGWNNTQTRNWFAEHLYLNGDEVKNLIIPEGVTEIKNNAFYGFKHITSISIPNSVESIGNFAFSGKMNRINEGVKYDRTELETISVGSGVKSIGYNAFCGCADLKIVNIADIAAWCNIRFEIFDGMFEPHIFPTIGNPLAYANHLYMNGKEVKDLVIPEGVETINSYAFYGCSGLTSVRIPNSLKSIKKNAFSGCNELTSVQISDMAAWCSIQFYDSDSNPLSMAHHLYLNDEEIKNLIIPNGVKGIGNNLFSGCSELASVTIGDNVTTIGDNAFSDCTKLSNVYLGKSVSKIWSLAFANCENISNVTCYAKSVPNTSSDAFENSYIEYATLHVNASSINAYRETDPWNKFQSIVAIESQKHTLIYMIDGEVYKTVQYEEGENITPEEAPTKDGYTFSGWSEMPKTMPDHDVTITGSFEPVYDSGNVVDLIGILLTGNVDDDDIALYDMNGDGELNIGDLILIMRAAHKKNIRSATNRAAAENQTIEFAADNITMKPGETKALNVSLASSISGIYGIQFEVKLPEGFSLENSSNGKVFDMSANEVDDITCSEKDLGNGVYRFIIYSSTLQELKGGSLMSLNLKADVAQTLGNYTVSIGNVALSDYDGHVTKEDGMFVAVKVAETFTLSYMVDGEDYKSFEIKSGENIVPEAEPTKEGYTFSGWSEIPETMPSENVTITGTFSINKYILTYIVDGEVYNVYSYDFGSEITPEAEPTKEGYTFSGWSEIPERMPANQIYVVGTFSINKYKITYVIDGEVFKTGEVEYGAEILTPTPEAHEGYDFEWKDVPATMPAEDIMIYGTYTATGIEAILASEPDVKIFTVSGKPLNKPQKGVNILRTKDGKTKKIMVK